MITLNEFLTKCYHETSYTHTVYFGATLLIGFHKTLIYPIFHKCSPQMESLHKMLVGMVVLIARVLTLMAYNVISRHNSLQINGPNIINPCLFDHEANNGAMNTIFKLSLDYNTRFPFNCIINNALHRICFCPSSIFHEGIDDRNDLLLVLRIQCLVASS